MVAVEEQPRKPLCLDSDLGNGHHLPKYAFHARSERKQHIRRGTVLPDDRAVQKRVDAKMRGAWTDQPPPHQVSHQGLVNRAVVGLRSDAVDDEGRSRDLVLSAPTGDIVHLHGRLGLREVTDPPRQDVELPGCAHRVDNGRALRRNSATNDLPVTKEMTKEAALLVLDKPQPDRLRIGTSESMTARLSIPIDSARSRCLHTILKVSRIVFDSLISSKKDS